MFYPINNIYVENAYMDSYDMQGDVFSSSMSVPQSQTIINVEQPSFGQSLLNGIGYGLGAGVTAGLTFAAFGGFGGFWGPGFFHHHHHHPCGGFRPPHAPPALPIRPMFGPRPFC